MKFLLISILIILSFNLAHGKIVERVVAVVNDDMVLLSEMNQLKKRLDQGILVFAELLSLKDMENLKKIEKSQMNYLIDERIIDAEVQRQGLQATTERTEAEIKQFMTSAPQLERVLKENGVMFSDYKNFVQLSLGRKSFLEKEISSKIKISDEEISAYYISEMGQGSGQVFEYQLAHILFSPDKGGMKAAKARAKKVHNKIKGNSESINFDELASKHSEDPHFSHKGLLGSFKSGEIHPNIEKAIKDLPAGDISPKIIKTNSGYHIIKVLKKTLVADNKYLEARGRIHETLHIRAFKNRFNQWLQQKREDSFIRIN